MYWYRLQIKWDYNNKKLSKIIIYIHMPNDLEQIKVVIANQKYMAKACDLSLR
jgi:hypothetical protein